MRGGCLFMPHSTKPLESGWRQCDFLRLPGRGVHTKRRQERAEYAEGSPASGVELTPHSARNYKGALKVRLHSTTLPPQSNAQAHKMRTENQSKFQFYRA